MVILERIVRGVLAPLLALALAMPMGVAHAGTTMNGPGDPEFVSANWRSFSPNGDGIKDRFTVEYQLPVASTVQMRVTTSEDELVTSTSMASQEAGTHSWVWDGRTRSGRTVDEGHYRITVLTPTGSAWTSASADLTFEASVGARDYGRAKPRTPAVYPRSKAVRDALELWAWPEEAKRVRLTIRSRAGRVVERRNLKKHPAHTDPFMWNARDSDRPLAPGRYRAIVSGIDALGNAGRSKPLHVRVSAERLVWVRESRTVRPRETNTDPCNWFYGSNECFPERTCGTVTRSRLVPGGLSHRAGSCWNYPSREHQAFSAHYIRVRDAAVRGVSAARIAFNGTPTWPGETDPGTLRLRDDRHVEVARTSASGARTPWVTDPFLGKGIGPDESPFPVRPGVAWYFNTYGTDAFDVGKFTVDVRYLVIAD